MRPSLPANWTTIAVRTPSSSGFDPIPLPRLTLAEAEHEYRMGRAQRREIASGRMTVLQVRAAS